MRSHATTVDALGRLPKFPDKGPCMEVHYRPADADDVPMRYSRAFEGSLWGAAILGPVVAGIFGIMPAFLGTPVPAHLALGVGMVIGTLFGVMTGGIAGAAEVDRTKIVRDHGRPAIRAGAC
ncbi:MAG: hypothetical protein D6705_11510 [Deltaproteobacteria bacterium]|nr:MAG: hypothetical protein D6705_11510 [Deltaproteobacteria bacterium]